MLAYKGTQWIEGTCQKLSFLKIIKKKKQPTTTTKFKKKKPYNWCLKHFRVALKILQCKNLLCVDDYFIIRANSKLYKLCNNMSSSLICHLDRRCSSGMEFLCGSCLHYSLAYLTGLCNLNTSFQALLLRTRLHRLKTLNNEIISTI